MTMRVPSYYEVHWIHILVEFEQIQQHSIPITQDINTTNMTEHITVVTHMVFDEPSMLYPTVNDDDDEIDQSDGDDVVSSQFESDDDNELKEGELHTPINTGSGSPIDDLVESGTIRLLDWNDSMTDIQLGMRFFDKVEAISAVRK
ncbi:hypothetical protein M9H77_04061 [Catharanthus roseus]|uniref:Uncharacterized protein n=1 Tax=Catharanthus roseus TaxID=4058 RepID=A0ACC0CDF3_CATRO|nr:hypothetical protein M9H77_04061 [Catharanthus roseus]